MSDNYVEYCPHYPRVSIPEHEGPQCGADHLMSDGGYFTCTLPPAHHPRHEAGIGSGLIAASWDREVATVTETHVGEEA